MPKRTEIPHGTNAGYRRGCRKQCCRTAHAETMREYRERRAAEAAASTPVIAPEPEGPPQEPRGDLPDIEMLWSQAQGPIERTVRKELEGHDAVVAFKDTLGEMLIFNAKMLDLTPVHQRFDVASGVQLRMLDIFRRLSETGLEPDAGDKGKQLLEALGDGGA